MSLWEGARDPVRPVEPLPKALFSLPTATSAGWKNTNLRLIEWFKFNLARALQRSA